MEKIKQKLTDLTAELIKIKSITGNYQGKKEVVDFVKKQFNSQNFVIKEYCSKNLPSLVINFSGDNNPDLVLNGHLDVVPAQREDFDPKIKGNRLYGRGSGDMKAGCAVMIEAMKYFVGREKKPSLGLMLTTDEEIGGFNGTGYLLKKHAYRPKLAIIPDGGVDLGTVVINEKGVLHIKLKEFGVPAHGSRPFLGKNAIERLIEKYYKIKKEIPDIKEKDWKNSMNLGIIKGGETFNKVPDYSEMELDIRFLSSKDRDEILGKIKKITSDFEILVEAPPAAQNRNNPYIKKYKEITEKKNGKKINFQKSNGASDSRFFSEKGVPFISTKIKCDNIHGEKEWVDTKEMVKFYNILLKYINNFKNL